MIHSQEPRLSTLWPEPNWSERVQAGLSVATAAILATLYQGFAKAPMRGGTMGLDAQQHAEIYTRSVGAMKRLFDEATTESLDELCRQYQAIVGVSHNMRERPTIEQLPFYALGRYGGRTMRSPFALSMRAVKLARALPDLGWPEDKRAVRSGICHWQVPSTNAWGVAKFSRTGIEQLAKPTLTRDAAAALARKLIDERVARDAQERKSIPKQGRGRSDFQRLKSGCEHRTTTGTPQDLLERFRLSDISFPPSVSKEARQRAVNAALDALGDLSLAIGLPSQWLGLAKLHLAIGSHKLVQEFDTQFPHVYGSIAEQERFLRVLRFSTDGSTDSLSSAWALALDHHIARHTLKLGPGMATESAAALAGWRDNTPARAIAAVMLHIVNYMRLGHTGSYDDGQRSAFFTAAEKIAHLNGANPEKWVSPSSMFARAFEAFVQDQLDAAGVVNPHVARGTRADELPAFAAAHAYPQGTERAALGALFVNLFTAIAAAARKTT